MLESCTRIERQILAAKAFIGQDLKLVVMPEYVLTGFPMGESTAQWTAKAAIWPEGPEYRALGRIAMAAEIFLAGNAYEGDRHFPGLYFQTSFILDPSGRAVLRYRRIISLFTPSPYDVFDRYCEVYGEDALFPVARTEIGCLAAIASEEILYPEIARAFALRGAEVLVHPSSEVASALPSPKNIAKRARAFENMAYVVSANTAGIDGIAIPRGSADGDSQIVDHRGLVIAQARVGESIAASAEIDIGALRRWRRRPGLSNTLSRLPLSLWRRALVGREIMHPNGLIAADGGVTAPTSTFYRQRQLHAIDRLVAEGVIA